MELAVIDAAEVHRLEARVADQPGDRGLGCLIAGQEQHPAGLAVIFARQHDNAASCIAGLKFHHQDYGGTSLRTHPPYNHYGVIPLSHLHRIGIAVLPPCIDTDHPGIDETPAAIQVARIDGVSPAIAIAALPRGGVYLHAGAKIPRILTTAPWIHWIFSD